MTPPPQPGEILTAIRVHKPPAGHGWAYEKLKRKVGDYATAAAAVILTVSGGRIASCAIGLTNVAGTALFAAKRPRRPSGLRSTRRRSRGPPPQRPQSLPPPKTAAARPNIAPRWLAS